MSNDPKVVAAVPGQGWVARYRLNDGGLVSYPVVAWVVYDDGRVVAVEGSISNNQWPGIRSNFEELVPPGGWAELVQAPKETKP